MVSAVAEAIVAAEVGAVVTLVTRAPAKAVVVSVLAAVVPVAVSLVAGHCCDTYYCYSCGC